MKAYIPYLEKVLSVRPLVAVQTEETLEAVIQRVVDRTRCAGVAP